MYVKKSIAIYMDKHGAIFKASDIVANKRSTLIDLRYHMIRDYIAKGLFKVAYVSSDPNSSGIISKGSEKVKRMQCTKMLRQDVD